MFQLYCAIIDCVNSSWLDVYRTSMQDGSHARKMEESELYVEELLEAKPCSMYTIYVQQGCSGIRTKYIFIYLCPYVLTKLFMFIEDFLDLT